MSLRICALSVGILLAASLIFSGNSWGCQYGYAPTYSSGQPQAFAPGYYPPSVVFPNTVFPNTVLPGEIPQSQPPQNHHRQSYPQHPRSLSNRYNAPVQGSANSSGFGGSNSPPPSQGNFGPQSGITTPSFSAPSVSYPTRPVPGIVSSSTDSAASKSVTPGSLEELLQIETQVTSILPRVLPAVVSIEGGSGVIVSHDGYILTASHVTRKSRRMVSVKLQDGRTVAAVTLGTNTNTDTAALKILSNGPWPFVPVGDSETVKVGDRVLALGYPLSFRRGTPSAVRFGKILKRNKNQFVSDCTIMGGDSGGPLIDLNGKLIGIGSRVKIDIKQNLHVPIQNYVTEWQQLAASIDIRKTPIASAPRAYLGIQGETDNDRVRIRHVHEGSPAERAGLLANDVLLQLGGKTIGKFDDVIEILNLKKPGEKVVAKLNRYGNLMQIAILLGPNKAANN